MAKKKYDQWFQGLQRATNELRNVGQIYGEAMEDELPLISRLFKVAFKISLGLVVAFVLVWLLYPAFAGFHTGFNAWSDNQCTNRIIQWCRDNPQVDQEEENSP